jgi:hypothetical protein
MASPFERAFAAAAVTHDRLVGDPFTFAPMKYDTERNAPLIPDQSRSVVQGVLCPFTESAARAGGGPFSQVGVQPERAAHATARPNISLDLSRLPWRPRIGDVVTQENTGRRFQNSRGFAVDAGLCPYQFERGLMPMLAREFLRFDRAGSIAPLGAARCRRPVADARGRLCFRLAHRSDRRSQRRRAAPADRRLSPRTRR